VITDIRMPPLENDEGIRVAHTLRETHPTIGVVVLSQYAEPRYPLALLDGGSAGRAYLLKESVHNRSQLVAAIEAVVSGESVIDPKVVEVLVEARAREEASPLSELTRREYEVLAEIAKGKSNAAIASTLFLAASIAMVVRTLPPLAGVTGTPTSSLFCTATATARSKSPASIRATPQRRRSPRATWTATATQTF